MVVGLNNSNHKLCFQSRTNISAPGILKYTTYLIYSTGVVSIELGPVPGGACFPGRPSDTGTLQTMISSRIVRRASAAEHQGGVDQHTN